MPWVPGGKRGSFSPKAFFFPKNCPVSVSWEPGHHGRAPTPLPAPNLQDGSWGGNECVVPRWERRSQERNPGGFFEPGRGHFGWTQAQHSPGRSAPIRGPRGAEGKDPQVSPSTRPSSITHSCGQRAPRCCRVPSWGHLRPRALLCSEHINPEPKSTPCSAARRGAAPHPPLRPPASSGHEGPRAEMRPGTLGLQPRG